VTRGSGRNSGGGDVGGRKKGEKSRQVKKGRHDEREPHEGYFDCGDSAE